MKRWIVKNNEIKKSNYLSELTSIPKEILIIMNNRGIETLEQAQMFINPNLNSLRDPFKLKDMDKAAKRIIEALEKKQKICIFGDYDVDGVCSTSLLVIFFKSIGVNVDYYIPNRLNEGYGLSTSALDKIKDSGVDLVITVDCGITSVYEAKHARDIGLDLIITDHHECQEELPDCIAVVNPKQNDDFYPFSMFCGCGIAFKLIQALSPEDIFFKNIDLYLEIVTLATICDMVPLIDENRIIVKNGLEIMRVGVNPGIKALFKVCGIVDKKIGSSHIGYSIGPRINAAGRLGYSNIGVKLLTSSSLEDAMPYANELEEKNAYRQELEATIYEQVEQILANDEKYKDEKVIVAAGENWQHGVIGIVASKITEKYYKPTILLNVEGEFSVGSARSIKGFNLFEAMNSVKHLMEKFGGHEQAAGLTIRTENIDKLREEINKLADFELEEDDMIEKINVEFVAPESCATIDFIDKLHILEPYGIGNPTPRFIFPSMRIESMILMGKLKNHIKLNLVGLTKHECVGFNMAHLAEDLSEGDIIDLVFQLDKNNFMGKVKPQLILKDIKKRQPYDYNRDKTSFYLDFLKAKQISNMSIAEGELVDGTKDDISLKTLDKNKIYESIKDKKTLIISETKQGYYSAMSSLNTAGIKHTFNDFYEGKRDKSGEYVEIIHAPSCINFSSANFDNIDNLILVDKPTTCIKKLVMDLEGREINIYSLYNNSSNTIQSKEVFDMDMDRSEFSKVYKYSMLNPDATLRWDECTDILGIEPFKLFVSLEVFKEVKLIDYKFNLTDGSVDIKLMDKPSGKVDLESTKFKNNIKILREYFRG